MAIGPKAPKFYKCVSCGRVLEVAQYSGMYSRKDTPLENVHTVNSSVLPSFTMFCTCGHYTVVQYRPAQ